LKNRFENDDQWLIRSAAEATIKDLEAPPEHAPKPMPSFEQTGWLMTYLASKGRGVPTGAAARLTMLDALREADEPVRMAAADHFGRVAGTDAVPVLTNIARESELPLREVAYKSLAAISMATGQRVQI
jgi:HEAT repeat protein